MRKPSKGWGKKDAYNHWNNHTDDQRKRFFKVLVGDFCKRLVLPDKLALLFRGRIARSIKLESPSGHTFDVQVANNLGRLTLQSGWESFVSAHDLKMLEFLVFKYDGFYRMKVLIFDPSGCEKVAPCFVMKNAIRKEQYNDISSNCANLSTKTPKPKGKARKQRDGSKIINISSSSSPYEPSGGSTSLEEHEAHYVPSYILPMCTSLTNVQKKKLKEKVGAICSEIPIYGCVMKKTHISGNYQNMGFFGKYADIYLPFKEGTLMLCHHGKSWEVICRVQVRRGQHNFKRRGHGLHVTTICCLEISASLNY